MDTHSLYRITAAERLRKGVVITFDDGKSALYSIALLRSTFRLAEDLTDWKLTTLIDTYLSVEPQTL
jgi:hypothetical protein